MAINTLITIQDALTKFVEDHEQLKRIEFEADDHREPKITEGSEFPMLFVAPIDVEVGRTMNTHTLRVYVYERINDDRSDVWENANDTSLLLRDIRVWWNDFGDDDIHIIEDFRGEFGSDRELDNLVGYFADIRFEIPSHGRCDVPINVTPTPPVPTCADANVENSDATYTDTVASGATLILPDSQINVNGVNEGNVVSVKTIDVNLTDGTNPVNPNDVTLVGNTLTIQLDPPLPCFPYRGAQFIIDPNDTEHSRTNVGATIFSVVGTRRATLFNGVNYVSPFYEYDGIDDYIEIEAGRYSTMQNALTFHAWINVAPVSGGTYVFLIPTTFSVGNGSFYVHYNGTTNQLILRGYNFSNVLTSYALGDVLAGNSGVNIMISVAHDFDSSTTYTYVNGVLFSTTTGVDLIFETGNTARRIGRVGGLYSEQKQGFTAMYNDLHTLAEVQAIFELTKSTYGY